MVTSIESATGNLLGVQDTVWSASPAGGQPAHASTPVALGTRPLRFGRTLWLELQGVLNWCTTEIFRQHVRAGLAQPCRRVVADLSRVEYVGGNGLRALLRLQDELAARGIELRLVVPEGSRCARTFALAKLNGPLATFSLPSRAWRHRNREGAGSAGEGRRCAR